MNSIRGLDPSRQCSHHNEQGRCASPAMLGETRCPDHSDSAAAAAMRERTVVRGARDELDRALAQGPMYNPPIGSASPPGGGNRSQQARAEGTTRGPGEAKRSAAEDEVHRMLFRGDITTGEGLIRLTERLVREFAAGKLEPRRFEIRMRAVRLMASLRQQFPAPPIDEPAEPQAAPEPDEPLIVEADRRPAVERAQELRQTRQQPRPEPGRQAIRNGTVSAEPEPSMRPTGAAITGDYKAKRRGEASRRCGPVASSREKSRRHGMRPARRLRFPPPHRSGNRDADQAGRIVERPQKPG